MEATDTVKLAMEQSEVDTEDAIVGEQEGENDMAAEGTDGNVTMSSDLAEPMDKDENPEAIDLEQIQDTMVLQLSLTGDSVQKFAKILHDKGLNSTEDAIQYFYALHNGMASPSLSSKKKVGRPRKVAEGSGTSEVKTTPSVWRITPSPANINSHAEHPGTVLVDGVRKSTRKRKNPYESTEYVPVPKEEGAKDSEAEEDGEDWAVVEMAADEEETEESRPEVLVSMPSGTGDDSMVDVCVTDDRPVSASLADVPETLPENALEGDATEDTSYIVVTKVDSRQSSSAYAKPKRVAADGKKLGRPRKRAKTAVLFDDEKETGNCRKCGQHFDNLSSLRTHKMDMHGRPGHPYFCEHCDYTAMYECDIKRHQLVHAKGKLFKCDICEFATNWERNFQQHMEKMHDNRKPWLCDRCDTKIYNQGKVKQHQLSHNPNALKCTQPHCNLLFETIAKLEWHVGNMHSRTTEKSLHCEHCSYAGSTLLNLKIHMKNKHGISERQRGKQVRREKTIQCEVCNRRLISKEQLVVHMQIHEPDNRDNEKPYYCNVCDARCSDLNQMVRHRSVHSDEKPFQCPHCDYRTRWKKDLKTHEMIHTGEKNIHCPHCNYSCYTRQRLRAHMIKHDESRKYICPLCNMTFKSRQALRMHTMYHTGDATFSCDLCDFRTVTEMRLRKHKLRHTDERNFSCNLCGKRFKQPHHVTQHRDIVHLGKPSYREKKRIALQQSAAEALGSLNSSEVNFGQTLVLNDDGTTTIVDIQAVPEPPRPEPTQYVMVETPAGYQYVAVVVPNADNPTNSSATITAGPTTAEFVQRSDGIGADATTLDATQMLLTHNDQVEPVEVYYTPAEGIIEPEAS